jgi:hypothetical protein
VVDEMNDPTSAPDDDLRRALDLVARLERQVEELQGRVDALESGRGAHGPATTPAASPRPAAEAVDPEIVTVISAAVAAYLGEEPRIRSIHLVRSSAWAQEGRATIQAWYSVSPPTPSVPTLPH